MAEEITASQELTVIKVATFLATNQCSSQHKTLVIILTVHAIFTKATKADTKKTQQTNPTALPPKKTNKQIKTPKNKQTNKKPIHKGKKKKTTNNNRATKLKPTKQKSLDRCNYSKKQHKGSNMKVTGFPNQWLKLLIIHQEWGVIKYREPLSAPSKEQEPH